ncbi:MAG: DUF2835 domain-containing protein [Candidatus Marinimicrobia bacterium]|nr:DUF2835 domain-containing protein [Candidatus Neomarinimicrobiota bacterium]MCF6266702.1 DUF2835 domain-containing protein [Desulfuromusa sp.]
MQKIYFRLQISQQQYLQYYQGTASAVQVIAENSQKIQFPAIRIRPFLTHSGIHGRFCLTIGEDNHFINLEKLSA